MPLPGPLQLLPVARPPSPPQPPKQKPSPALPLPDPLLIRVVNVDLGRQGEGVDVFFDREDEIRTFECMSRHGQGPRLLRRFPNGRVEEFINARTLSAADLRDPETSALIALKLREFHELDVPGPKNVLLWERLRNWLKAARMIYSIVVNELDSIHFSIKMASKLVKEIGRQVATDRCIMAMLFLIVAGVVAIIIVKIVNPHNKDIADIPGLAPPAQANRRLLWDLSEA